MLCKEVSGISKIISYSIWLFILIFMVLLYNSVSLMDKIIFLCIPISIFIIFLIMVFNKLVLIFNQYEMLYSFFPYTIGNKIEYRDIKKFEIININPISDFWRMGI